MLLPLLLGLILGAGLAIRGWTKPAGLFAIASSIGSLVFEVFRSAEVDTRHVRDAFGLFQELGIFKMVQWTCGGLLLGLVFTVAVGWVCVFLPALHELRSKGNVDAWAGAGRQASHLVVHGIQDYLATFAPSATNAWILWHKRRSQVQTANLEALRRALMAGALIESRFRDLIQLQAATFLGCLFEPTQMIQDFRLGIYRATADGKQFEPYIVLQKGAGTAQRASAPLSRTGSFMGASLDEGSALVYPRDKGGRPFEKRAKGRYKSFLVVPIPSRAHGIGNMVLTIDHMGGPEVFDAERTEAATEFAQFIDIAHRFVPEAINEAPQKPAEGLAPTGS